MVAEGRYIKIKSRFWCDEKVRNWDNDTKFLALYLLTSPHNNILGCYVLPKLYVCADLGWTPEALAKPFAKLLEDGFIKYDEEACLILLTNYLKHNPIDNGNRAEGAIKILEELPRSPLFADLKNIIEEQGKDYLQKLAQALENKVLKGNTKGFDKAFDKGFGEGNSQGNANPAHCTLQDAYCKMQDNILRAETVFGGKGEDENKNDECPNDECPDDQNLQGHSNGDQCSEHLSDLDQCSVVPEHSGGDQCFDHSSGDDQCLLEAKAKNTSAKSRKARDKPKIKYAEFVSLAEEEYTALLERLGSEERVQRAIEILDNYKGASGRRYKSDYRAILNWVIDRLEEEEAKAVGRMRTIQPQPPPRGPKSWNALRRVADKIGANGGGLFDP